MQDSVNNAPASLGKFTFGPLESKTGIPFPQTVDMQEFIAKIRDLNYGVPVAHHSFFAKQYAYTFTGKEIISWIFDSMYQKRFKRETLLPLAQELLDKKVIETVYGALKTHRFFDDSKVLYRYARKYRRQILVIGGGFAGLLYNTSNSR